MSDDPNKNWTDEEAAVLRSLRDEPAPSAGLEERIVNALKQRGRIRARGGPMAMIGKTAGIVAAAAAVFIGGFVTGNRNVEATKAPEPVAIEPAAHEENQYMLLMFTRGEDRTDKPRTERPASGVVYGAIIEEYRQWAMDRAAEGRLVSAEKLASDTRVMTTNAGQVAIASSARTDRVLGGYFLISAASLDEAIEIAKSHPHLKYGGEVEVRPIEVTRR